MRIGIATGEPIIGLIGNKRQSYTALGDVVNLASRLEELSRAGCVTIDEETYGEIKNFFNVQRRFIQNNDQIQDTSLSDEINECMQKLNGNENNLGIIKKLGALQLQIQNFELAHEYFKRAIKLNPDDQEAKLGYADSLVKVEQNLSVTIRGRKGSMHLYEVESIVDPLLDRVRIPQHLYDKYHNEVAQLLEYPENLVLPVECIDGSIGHSRTVGFIAYAIADSMDLPDQEKTDILEAGYLADIGKSVLISRISYT